MKNHPNYKGYDATKGNPHARPERPKTELIGHIGKVTAADLYETIPEGWLRPLNAVSTWCAERDIDFCPSPFPYQIAKVMGGEFTIVLWASKRKGSRAKFIKPAFEGPTNGFGADQAMSAIRSILA